MSVFIRRYTFDPGNEVLLEIESVNILDLEPPASITGVGSGTVLIFGEFENGPYNVPTEVSSSTELQQLFGGFGYVYNGTVSNNPCARTRSADGAIVPELWNGNGSIQLNGKKFRRLLICRADTSVGAVSFSRLAYLVGAASFSYNLEPAQAISFKVDGGAADTATFTGVAATALSVAATFAAVAGDTLVLGYDAATNFTVTFLTGDTTVGAWISRINQYAGFTFASLSGGQVLLTGLQRGSGGQVRVVGGTTIGAVSGLAIANTAGTGNSANVDAVTPAEINTIINAATASDIRVEVQSDGKLRMVNYSTPLTGTLEITAATATTLGFTVGQTGTAVTGTDGVIPAGTRVRVPAGQQFVTTQDLSITAAVAGASGAYTVKIRHATDDGTGLLAIAGAITEVQFAIDLGSFSVQNQLPVTAALTEPALDSVYVTAIGASLDLNNVAAEVNITYCARQSNQVRISLRQNAIDASAIGMLGRMCCIRPPLNTAKSVAQSVVAQPGVGAYRDQRVIYCYPGFAVFVPPIALKGTTGGTGFNATGIIDVGADGFMASICSQLPPEENPGQETTFLSAVASLERGANVQNLTITDYINFRSKGIAAPRIQGGVAFFQSGVTSVDPLVNPNLRNIARRRMADFIEDTIARRLVSFGKKLNSSARRIAITSEIRSFMNSLLSKTNPGSARIAGFVLDPFSANTPDSLAAGIFRLILRVRTLSSLDSIVLATTVGEAVDVSEAALPQTGLR